MKMYDNFEVQQRLKKYVASKVAELQVAPTLHIIQIGDEFASQKYIHKKQQMGLELGIAVVHHHFSNTEEVLVVQSKLNSITQLGQGVIVQLPVPPQFQGIVDSIPWQCDVDLLGLQSHFAWHVGLLPPTIAAIDLVLKSMLNPHFDSSFFTSTLDLQGKTVAVIGQGVLVGNPLLRYLRDRFATIISINKDTPQAKNLVQFADVVITGAGVPNLINSSWLKSDVFLIDAATSESNNKLVGDLDYNNLPNSALVCKSPGGVGPLTVLCLFLNAMYLAKNVQ